MEGFVATKLEDFEQGKISRRKLIEALTAAATTVYATGAEAAPAPADNTLKAALVNHISYTCADFHKTADWYSKMFNLDQIGVTKTDAVLPFGKKGEKPFGVTADDVPLTHLIVRSRDLTAPPPGQTAVRRKSKALVNHIAYTIADFDQKRVRAELKRQGYDNPREDGDHSFHVVDPNGYDVQICGIDMTAISG